MTTPKAKLMNLRPDAELAKHINEMMREQELRKIENECNALLHDVARSNARLRELNTQRQNIIMSQGES